MRYEMYNLLYKHTPYGFITLSSATAVWSPVVVDAGPFYMGTYYVDIRDSNASAAARGTKFNSYLYRSPDNKSWFLQTAFPSLSSAGAGGINLKHYSKFLTDFGGGYLRLKYACYSASAKATTEFRARLELKEV